jgi:peroxiredoxin
MKARQTAVSWVIAAAALFWMLPSARAARVGERAPDFSVADTNGKTQKLSDYAGKFVVLEWSNRGCPYTQKHYNSGNMQRLQREWTQRGVIRLTVISSAPRKQGYVTAEEENSWLKKINGAPTAVLLDPQGTLGHLYDAKTSPQMFVINPQGTLVYDGAIDDKPATDPADIGRARNYLSQALGEAIAGKPVSTPTSRPYGCSVKYPGTWF